MRLDSDPQADNPTFDIILKTDNIALFVWLEFSTISGRFSENGFHILKGTKKIKFYSFEEVTVDYVIKNLLVTSLSQIYSPNNHKKTLEIIESQLYKFGLEQE